MADEETLREYLRWVTADLHQTRQRLRDLESGDQEPIAIIAMSCRLPGGVSSPEDLWELVTSGTDAISAFPAGRGWDPEVLADSSFATEGGFLDGVDAFDPAFFGISPREALAMDPQQRLLLETAWEALERAGVDIASLRGSRTGVFAGTTGQDYAVLLQEPPEGTAGYVLTGTAASVVSGRIAYTLGLEGPAISVDTACSTSLVALHLAAQSLRAGECALALAGGATVMATPTAFFGFDEQGGLAADGRCKPFGAAADGTSWSEGAGMLLLERLSDAHRNGHEVLAVLRGSAVNSDGASNGLTAPNGPSQQRVILEALAKARLSPSQVDLLEAHGTGTRLGDPIEADALHAVYGSDRAADRPLWLGSVKSNVGHTQAAAGVTGVIKTVLAVRNGMLPATLHADEPTPHVDWSGAIALLTDGRPWPETGEPRRGAVSAFGMSGTNAHVIVEQAPDAPAAQEAEPAVPSLDTAPLLLSARTPAALRGQAARLRAHLAARPDLARADVAFSLLTDRVAFPHRLAVTAADRDRVLTALDAAATGTPSPHLLAGTAAAAVKPVFVFPGQGSQWAGMAAGLLESAPAFRAEVEACAAALAPHLDWSVLDLLRGVDGAPALEAPDVVQPALFAVMSGLAALWRAHGVEPAAVIGHSQGEIAAAYVAGALSREDAAMVVARRSTALRALSGRGGMVSVALPADEVRERLDGVSLAAVNGPSSTVVSGATEALAAFVAGCERDGIRVRRIGVDYASHSVQVEEIEAELAQVLAGVAPREGSVPFWSTVEPGEFATTGLDAGYWYRNLRQTVEFEATCRALVTAGHSVFIEVSPHPVLTVGVEGITALGTLRRDEPDRFAVALADAHVHGVAVDWTPVVAGARRVALPTYAFDRQRYWPEPPDAAAPAADTADGAFWAAVERGDTAGLATAIDHDTADALTPLLPALTAWRRRGRAKSTLDSWRYRVTWRPVDDPGLPALRGTWLAVLPATASPLVETVLDAVAHHGATVVATTADGICEALDGDVAGILNLLPLGEDGERVHAGVPGPLAATVALTVALERAAPAAPVWTLTSGGVSVGRADEAEDPAQAMTWGFGRVAGLENPGWWGGMIDVSADPDARALARVCAALTGTEDQVAVRRAGILARRLVRAPRRRDPGAAWTPRGTVLITGGTGALGSFLARWAIRSGAEHVVLAGRRGPDAPGAADLVTELEALGGRATVVACDVADAAAVSAMVAGIRDGLTAVVHAAGVSQLSPIAETSPDEFADVVTAKALGAAHLHAALADADLDAFVLFSSISGVWGSGGQGAYAAANTYLDALARTRRAAGRAATAVSWGAWGGAGMAKGSAEALLSRRGLPTMDPDVAIAALAAAVGDGETSVTVADVRWDRFVPTFTVLRPSPLIGELPEVREVLAAAAPVDVGAGTAALRARLDALPVADRLPTVVAMVRAEAAAVLGYASPDDLDTGRAFRELGFDSITAVDVRNRLATATGVPLATTVVFDHPTVTALAEHVVAEVADEPESLPAPVTAVAVADDDPVVVVGMACRYPGGVASPEDLWELVAGGRDAMSAFPTDRGWDLDALAGGDAAAGVGGFLHDAAEFDPGFFGISPREAVAMDPQQRLLLEVSWEAMERAGIDPRGLRGSDTAVFAGTNGQDYTTVLLNTADGAGAGATSTAASVLSGRVSYTFGLEGPAATIDTGCSSSLVALHLAARALRNGECSLALVGGVSVISTPFCFTEFTRQGALALDGRCKSFADTADGTGWGEGVGVLVMERLSRARRHGHRVLAVVSGSAMNQDGASNGLTAPNGPSQQRVIRAALADAGLTTRDVDVVEAHGTGTTLGDPIEAQALLATYGRDRERPLLLGSIKSNLGHTQAAAGVAGVIKMVMSMRHGAAPATLHVEAPSTRVDWASGAVELLTEARDWPVTDRARRAAVSSFGVSGTNAHVILTAPECEPQPAPPGDAPPALAWTLSGRTASGLRAQAARLHAVLAGSDPDPRAVGHALDTTRARFEHRAVVVGDTATTLLDGVAALAENRPAAGLVTAAAGSAAKPVFVFAGQGGQWAGMALDLLDAEPVFADHLAACEHALSEYVDWSLTDALRGADIDRVDVVQPALWAIMVALAALWRHYGVEPAAVVGHSQGELAAAVVAGALSLDDGARIVAQRARVLRGLSGPGGALSVALPADAVRERIAGLPLDVAVVNGPASVVVAGDRDVLDELRTACTADAVRSSWVKFDYAPHSAHIDRVRAELEAVFAGVTPKPGDVPFFSTVEARWVETTELDAGYWYRNVRQTVEFDRAIGALAEQGHQVFVEIGPHPVLQVGIGETLAAAELEDRCVVVGTLRRDEPGPARFLRSVGEVAVRGVPVDWSPLWAGARPVELPTYAFEHEHFWAQQRTGAQLVSGDVTAAGLAAPGHPLLGAALVLAGADGVVLTSRVSLRTHPWLADHRILDTVLLPGAAYVELAVQAGERVGCGRVEELTLEAPLVLPDAGAVDLQIAVGAPDAAGARPVTVHGRADDGPWTRHAAGTVTAAAPAPAGDAQAWAPAGEPVDLDGHYERLVAVGYQHGPLFQGLRAVWRTDAEILAEVALPDDARATAGAFALHPALLDAALQAAGQGELLSDVGSTWLPFSWRGVTVHATGATALRVTARAGAEPSTITLDLTDLDGRPVATVEALAVRPVTAGALPRTGTGRDGVLLRTEWVAGDRAGDRAGAPWAVLGDLAIPGAVHAPDLDALAGPVPATVVLDLPAPGPDPVAATHELTAHTLAALHRWLADDRCVDSLLVVATRGATADSPVLAHAAVWGLVRSAQSENPGRFLLADLPAHPTPADLTALTAAGTPEQGQLSVRDGQALAVRLVRTEPATAPDLDTEGTVLVTGATGGLGGPIAEWLVTRHGARRLLLASRSGPAAPGAQDLVDRLAALGAEATVVAADVTDPAAVATLAAAVPAAHPLTMVVHAAGVLDDAVVTDLTPERLAPVLAPKVDAAWHLHELTSGEHPAELVLLSSAAGTFGGPAQGNYAAANAFLDALAGLRAAAGLPGVAIAWGPWAELGQAAALDDVHARRLVRSGMAPLPVEQGLALFDAARAAGPAVLALRLARPASADGVHPLLRRHVTVTARPAADRADAGPSMADRLTGHTGTDRRKIVLDVVRETVAAVLGLASPAAVEVTRGFLDIGFDSLTAVELRNRLTATTGTRLPATLIFDHPTPEALARHLHDELGEPDGAPALALLADLDRLAASIAGIRPDDADRDAVADRLRGLLAAVGAPAAGPSGELDAEINAATAEDIFELLDGELGRA